jgi:ubiquinone/menaquinone biosynthesis C-methylase UbiE
VPEARYDGLADWYEEWASGYVRSFAPVLAARVVEFVTRESTVIEVGCGTGLHFSALQAVNIYPIGVDVSADQLRLAGKRSAVVRADAAALPVPSEAIDAAVAAFVHRDVDDFAGAVAEVARVLRPGSRFVSVGTHRASSRRSSTEPKSVTSARSRFDPATETPSAGLTAPHHHIWPPPSAHAISPLPHSWRLSSVPD